MELAMSSPVEEFLRMENDNGNGNVSGGVILTKLQRRKRNRALRKKLNADMVSKEHDHAQVANGKTGEGGTTNVDVKSPEYLHNLEAVKGAITASTGNPASKKRKRNRMKNKNLGLGGVIATCESTQEGFSTSKIPEVKSGETIYGKTATPDANVVSNRDHTEVANGKMRETKTTHINVNGEENKKQEQKSKNKRPTLGEILNPQNLEAAKGETGSGTTSTDIPTSKERKRQKVENNPDLGDIVSVVCPQVTSSELGPATIVPKSAELEIGEAEASKAWRRKEITQVATLGKKLLVLDVNGLLADVKATRHEPKKVIKRPYLDEFLSFCFERFNVGIWSSRPTNLVKKMVEDLIGDLKKKLLFVWGTANCTHSHVRALTGKKNFILVKDLRKIWDEDGPRNAWMKGTFCESNTLLVDDSPHKALLNPPHTGIFPATYDSKNKDDNFLAPKGDFQNYLEGLAAAGDVREYVKRHPFGQGAIDYLNPHWDFYSYVIHCLKGGRRNTNKEVLARVKYRSMKASRNTHT